MATVEPAEELVNDGLYVQYGCGWDVPDGWLNFDASPTLLVERLPFLGAWLSRRLKGNPAPFPRSVRFGDIRKGLPVPDHSCAGVYCSHVLEHLALNDCRQALRNTRRLLAPGGVFRLVLPDLRYHAEAYLASGNAHDFMRDTRLGSETRRGGITAVATYLFGNSYHLWMWDYDSLRSELRAAGFTSIRRAALGDSVDPRFAEVEREQRWTNCLGIECRAS